MDGSRGGVQGRRSKTEAELRKHRPHPRPAFPLLFPVLAPLQAHVATRGTWGRPYFWVQYSILPGAGLQDRPPAGCVTLPLTDQVCFTAD